MTAEEVFTLVLACIGISGAAILIARMARAERRLRSLRLSTLETRTRRRAQQLNAILVAENAKLVAKGIDQGSILMQGGHRLISDVTFALLDLIPATRAHARVVRETHNLVSTGLYGAFREINRQVTGRLAEKRERPKAARKKPTKRQKVRDRVKKRVAKKSKR
jgi:hypothetical protein